MAQETVLRKRSRDGDKVCTSYVIPKSSYKFTFETCDDVECTIKDKKGNTVAVLNASTPTVTISNTGNYNICIEGIGLGTLFAEYVQGGGGEDCCDELREKDVDLQNQIDSAKSRVTALESQVNNIINGSIQTGCCIELNEDLDALEERVRRLEEGGGGEECCDELRTEISNIKNRLTAVENKLADQFLIATYGTTTAQEILAYVGEEPFAPILLKRGNDYYGVTELSRQADNKVILRTIGSSSGEFYVFTYTITDGTWASSANGLQQKLTAGNNITIENNVISSSGGGGGGLPADFAINGGDNAQVVRNGNQFTISATDTVPDVDKAYVDAQIAAIGDNDTVTTITAGNNVSVVDNGTGGNHAYTISATDTIPDVDKAYVDAQIAAIGDNDTVTTLSPGNGISITDSGTGGNHAYTVSATGGSLPADFDIQQGSNVQVAKSGNTYTISATDTVPDVNKAYVDAQIAAIEDNDTVTTLSPGSNITIVDNGTGGDHAYTVSATPALPADFSIAQGSNVQVAKSGNAYTISATDTVPDVNKAYVDAQIAAIEDNDTVTILTPGTGISITDNGTGGNHNYTVTSTITPQDYMIFSRDPNIVITVRGDSSQADVFPYDVTAEGATADNNHLENFTSGTDKIEIAGTSLTKGDLTEFATSGAGIYYNTSTKVLSYNDGTDVKTIVKITDNSTLAATDVKIV